MDRDSTLYGTPGSGRNSTIMSPASRNIEKSLNELDDLINKRRLELSNLRSNNRVFSADKMLQEGLDKTTPPMNHIGTNHIHTSSSSSSIRSNTINSNISPYLASTIPNASISNNGTSPSYSPYGSVTAPDRAMGSAYNTRPPLYTSPMPYGSNTYSNELSRNTGLAVDGRNTGSMPSSGNHYGHGRDNQDMMTISNTKYNELENQLQYFQNKVCSLTYSLTYSLIYLLAYLLTYSLTQSLTQQGKRVRIRKASHRRRIDINKRRSSLPAHAITDEIRRNCGFERSRKQFEE
jgi:hypothetical protein